MNQTVERAVSGQPHKGKVFVAVHAHVDDVPYLAAGLCAKLIAEGYTGYLVRTTNDEHSGSGTNAQNILTSEQEHAKIAAALGMKDVFEFYYRNDRMEEISKSDLRGRLMLIYRMVKADTVITFHPDGEPGLHLDRAITGRAAADAADLCANPHENWEHVEAGFAARRIETRYYISAGAGALFNRVIDIAPFIEKKIDAIAECKSFGGGNLGADLRTRLASEGKRIQALGNDDWTANREYTRQFLLDDSRSRGKPHKLQFAERFTFVDLRQPERSKVDDYVKQNVVRI